MDWNSAEEIIFYNKFLTHLGDVSDYRTVKSTTEQTVHINTLCYVIQKKKSSAIRILMVRDRTC